ncbi:hypothetical protein N7489_000750 [Penicillium chrysogenum]|uniref:Hypervirulence associated protein TUDOR domain-containing protein n=1 Tax=Penicillium chrysogenum TaxID=5076 RepID=A0ABQ8WGW6_PENCH|nr:uncharacterized protein N7489_000750 [Penicillium chrysogenum]KAJ5250340.1 hypothetical protein N7489_000750 [Penicillium chrysogenum]KAJ5269244.1 hypothetical protein N7505_005002 [Penicillium chrysogenum]
MSVEEIQDKQGNNINEGDFVNTTFRGGSHEGKVQTVVKDEAAAQREGVPSYPKASPTSARQCFSLFMIVIPMVL